MRAFARFNGRKALVLLQVIIKNQTMKAKVRAPFFHDAKSFQDKIQLLMCQTKQTTKAGGMILWQRRRVPVLGLIEHNGQNSSQKVFRFC
jgi:predicted ATPase